MVNNKYDWKVVPLNVPNVKKNKSKKIDKNKKKKSKCDNAVVVDWDSLSF